MDTTNIRISATQMESEFFRILLKLGFQEEKARTCASVFTNNSLEGVLSHGVNRFPRFVNYIKKGLIDIHAEPECVHTTGAFEQWDGHSGPGPLNAITCTERAMNLSDTSGIGCVALANTNHWMRGGTYGWQAAKAGYVFIGWTNTIGNMPAWGATDHRLGNNPLVMAVPFGADAIVLDMAMSQYSFGQLEKRELEGNLLEYPGGYNLNNELSNNPSDILVSNRSLPIGYWKGAGLSLLLDILSAIFSGGLSTSQISREKYEMNVSQVFIAMNVQKLRNFPAIRQTIYDIISDYKNSVPIDGNTTIRYPGENTSKIKQENLLNGILVNKSIWNEISSF